MRIALFCHSLRSDWNHGNAHFLRGVVSELQRTGDAVRVFEQRTAWSAVQLAETEGVAALDAYRESYPELDISLYEQTSLDLERALEDTDLVVVHEWNARWLIAALGRWRRRHPRARLLFHDTHHRAITRPEELTAFDLGQYDGVLAFGACLRDIYLHHGWAARAWVWHEAADVRRFRPLMAPKSCDLVWIGNWGDEERTAELAEYLLGPAAALSIATHVYGVRYPDAARRRLASAGAEYQGWLPNARVPDIFAAASVTMHVPRRPYAERLHGIPTIRVFEALACGIPLITAPWIDSERLFTESADYLMARSGREMTRLLRDVLEDPGAAQRMAAHGLATIRSRHTCAHRVFELREIAAELGLAGAANIPAGQVPA